MSGVVVSSKIVEIFKMIFKCQKNCKGIEIKSVEINGKKSQEVNFQATMTTEMKPKFITL